METQTSKECSRSTFYAFLEEKILIKRKSIDRQLISSEIEKIKPEPGFILVNGETQPRDVCQLCCQIPYFPVRCSACKLYYCKLCCYILVLIRNHLNGNKDEVPVNKILNKQFDCLNCVNCTQKTVVNELAEEEKSAIKQKIIKCNKTNCFFNGKYMETIQHIKECKGDMFKFDQTFIGEIFKQNGQMVEERPYNLVLATTQPEIATAQWVSRLEVTLEDPNSAEFDEIDEIMIAKRSANQHPDEPSEKRSTTPQSSIENDPKNLWDAVDTEPVSPRPMASGQSDDPWGSNSPSRVARDIEQAAALAANFKANYGKSARNRERRQRQQMRKQGVAPMLVKPSTGVPTFAEIFAPNTSSVLSATSTTIPSVSVVTSTITSTITLAATSSSSTYNSRPAPTSTITTQNINRPTCTPTQSNISPQSVAPTVNNPSTRNSDSISNAIANLTASLPSTSSSTSLQSQDAADKLIKYNPLACPRSIRKKNYEFTNIKSLIKARYRHRHAEKWNARKRNSQRAKLLQLLDEKKKQVLRFMAPPQEYSIRITDAVNKLKNRGIKVCALDAEMIRIKMKSGEIFHVPIWIAIIDGTGTVIYHEFVRHNTAAIVNWQQDKVFHGLNQEDVSKAKGFRTVRREVLTIFQQYDRIVVCGQTVDFAALFCTMDDYYQILPKILDINSYFNCYSEANGLGLKYCSYILFNTILQKHYHSPLVDAAFTLWCYLFDFEGAEEVHQRVIRGPLMAKGHGFSCYLYPKNRNMAGRLHAVMRLVKDWPAVYKTKPFQSREERFEAMQQQKYIVEHFITGTPERDLQPPYALTGLEMINFTRHLRL